AGALGRVDPAPPRPALAEDLPVAGVDRDDQAVGEARRERLERGRSGDDAGGSCREPSLDRARGAKAAARLNRDAAGSGDAALDEAGRGAAREGAVEIDEVEQRRTLGGEARGGPDGVAALDGHVLPVALGEPDASPFEDVQAPGATTNSPLRIVLT